MNHYNDFKAPLAKRYEWLNMDGELHLMPHEDYLLGLKYIVDPLLPPGTAEFRDSDGRVVGRIIGIDYASNAD